MAPLRICDGPSTYWNLREYKSNCNNFNHSTCKWMESSYWSVEYFVSADDVHIRYFHRQQPPEVNAWDRLWFGDKCSHMPWRCPRPCRRLCPRYIGGIWEPGFFKQWRPREKLLVKNEFIFCICISQLSRSLQSVYWSQNLFRRIK